MANLRGFDANQVNPDFNFDPIPKARYLATITESSEEDTKDRTGKYIKFTFTVQEGEYKGRSVWSRLNLKNANQTAVKIAESELSAICRAVGVLKPQDSTELHNIPLVIDVDVEKRSDDPTKFTNTIAKYSRKEAAVSQAPAGAAAETGKAPWQR